MFMIGALIIAIAASAISVKTLVGYTEMRSVYKILISLLIVSAWFAPVIVSVIRATAWGNTRFFAYVSDVGYFLFGIVFLLLILLLLRDFLWFFAYETAKLIKSPYAAALNPSDVRMLNLANLYTVALTFLLGFYALYEGIKLPAVKEVTLASPALKREYTLVQLSDLHINRTIPPERIEKLVEKVNALEPDVILLTGDIGDDKVEAVGPQMAALEELQSKYGIFAVFGNHEFYNGLMPWQFKFGKMGWSALFNYGLPVKDTELYVGGVPDVSIARGSPFFKIDVDRTLENSSDGQYKILLSHTPRFQKEMITKAQYDLKFSGEPLGGQIFPFHLLVKQANKYLAGLYDVNDTKLYLSRGAGYWGPPMRLFAPSEITVIRLKPEK